MIRVTTIRETASRTGRAFGAAGRSWPGPVGLVLRAALVVFLLIVAALVIVPVIILGVVMLAAGLLVAWVRALRVPGFPGDDGRRNVRVMTRTDAPLS